MAEQPSGNEKRIVAVAIDDSEYAEKAFTWYLENGRKDNDYIVLIHCPEVNGLTTANPGVLRELSVKAQQLEDKYKLKLESFQISGKFLHCTGHGKPGESICKMAREQNASLIITGTRGMGTIRRTLMGSVSDYIVHHSHVPVLVCRH